MSYSYPASEYFWLVCYKVDLAADKLLLRAIGPYKGKYLDYILADVFGVRSDRPPSDVPKGVWVCSAKPDVNEIKRHLDQHISVSTIPYFRFAVEPGA